MLYDGELIDCSVEQGGGRGGLLPRRGDQEPRHSRLCPGARLFPSQVGLPLPDAPGSVRLKLAYPVQSLC